MPASSERHPLLLRARVVLPVSRAPIRDGAVLIAEDRIVRVGCWKDVSCDQWTTAIDLGDCALLPGFVNAHCHLDYTDMAGMFPPQKSFIDWIKLITTAKAGWNYSEFAASWLRGAQMLLRTGTTTVGDFEAIPELLSEVLPATPLRIISFLELTGVRSRRNPRAILRDALLRIKALPAGRSRVVVGPHAPYSTIPELLRLSARTARRRGWPLSIHVAESRQEFEMFTRGDGLMFGWLKRNEREMTDCGIGTPVQHLHSAGVLGKNLLAVHANYLGAEDAALLGRRKVSVAHCPRSHAYFRHDPFPLRELVRAGVNVCLGTDSLATVYRRPRDTLELSMFEEMRTLAAAHSDLPAKTILQMATRNGARALGLGGQLGELSADAFADLIAVPFAGKTAEACRAVVRHRGPVAASMIGGQWTVAPAGSGSDTVS